MKQRLLFLLPLLGLSLLMVSCLPTFEAGTLSKMEAYFSPQLVPKDTLLVNELGSFYYVYHNLEAENVAIFIHGSPGSWDNFKWFLKNPELQSSWGMISVDRPGYGGTNPGVTEPSLERQAKVVAQAFDVLDENQNIVLIGHSLGGPVAAQVAIDFPNLVDGLIFVAALMDPELEKTKWIQYPATWPIIRSAIPEALRVCNEEILPLKAQLEEQKQKLATITQPSIILQGEEDELVPPGNADYLMKHLTRAETSLHLYPESNHFIPFTQPGLIKKAMNEIRIIWNSEPMD